MKNIKYVFKFENGSVQWFEVDLERRWQDHLEKRTPGDWTRLDFHQCSNCPLKPRDVPYCPVALDLEAIAEKFARIMSNEQTEVHVITDERTYYQKVDVQSGLKSLFGLIMASSGCPILSRLRAMAHFHLPFSSMEETVYRVAGNYLLTQHFKSQDGEVVEGGFDGLKTFYGDLEQVNMHLMQRIRASSEEDANINAVCIFFSTSAIFTMGFDDMVNDMKKLFG